MGFIISGQWERFHGITSGLGIIKQTALWDLYMLNAIWQGRIPR